MTERVEVTDEWVRNVHKFINELFDPYRGQVIVVGDDEWGSGDGVALWVGRDPGGGGALMLWQARVITSAVGMLALNDVACAGPLDIEDDEADITISGMVGDEDDPAGLS